MSGFKKFDEGKLRYSLLPKEALEEVVKVLQFGAAKYGDNSWRDGAKVEWLRYYNAVNRHMAAWVSGEDLDPESGLSHLAHAAASIFFLLQYQIEGIGIDNRDPRIGLKFGKLTITRFLTKDKKHRYYECTCECGGIAVTSLNNLNRKNTESCGCIKKERAFKTHGKSASDIYNRYRTIMSRCYDPKSISYENYGMRGIKVDEAWHIFENFYHDMGDPPFDKAQIDRIDNNGNYSKENCRWVTPKENVRNNSKTKKLQWLDKEWTLEELAIEYNMPTKRLAKRIRMGWELERALTEPPVVNNKRLKEEYYRELSVAKFKQDKE